MIKIFSLTKANDIPTTEHINSVTNAYINALLFIITYLVICQPAHLLG